MRIEGAYFPAGSSSRVMACLQVSDQGRVRLVEAIGDETLVASCAFVDLRVSVRIGNTPRHLEFADGGCFETSDNHAIDDLNRRFETDTVQRWLHVMESRLPIVFLLAALTLAGVWGGVRYGVPVGASWLAASLPVEASGYIAQGSLKLLDESVFQPSALATARRQELADLFAGYTAEYPRLKPEILFRQSKQIGANALALPDGHIVFTDALVELAEDDQELIAILAHEIGHLAQRHTLRRIIQGSMLSVVIVLVTGDVTAASSIIATVPTLLLELSYSREFEREADDFCFELMHRRGLDTRHFANIMRRLEGQGASSDTPGGSAWWSTHPATRERIERFDREA
jgi:hypothetical protein